MRELCKSTINTKNKNKKINKTKKIDKFDEVYRKKLQVKFNDKNEFESICKSFTTFRDETKKTLFINMNIKTKSIFLVLTN